MNEFKLVEFMFLNQNENPFYEVKTLKTYWFF